VQRRLRLREVPAELAEAKELSPGKRSEDGGGARPGNQQQQRREQNDAPPQQRSGDPSPRQTRCRTDKPPRGAGKRRADLRRVSNGPSRR